MYLASAVWKFVALLCQSIQSLLTWYVALTVLLVLLDRRL